MMKKQQVLRALSKRQKIYTIILAVMTIIAIMAVISAMNEGILF